jgi:hypothetical protein
MKATLNKGKNILFRILLAHIKNRPYAGPAGPILFYIIWGIWTLRRAAPLYVKIRKYKEYERKPFLERGAGGRGCSHQTEHDNKLNFSLIYPRPI